MAWNGIVGSAYLNCVVGTLTVLAASPARADDSMPAVAPQPLANALEGIARQASLQLIYSSSLSNGVNSPGAPAGLTWRESLHEVLKGTGLTYQLVNEHTVTILPEPKTDSDQSGSALDQSLDAGAAHSDRRRNRAGMPMFGEPPPDQMVVITGSHISGVEPSGGQVITIRRKEMERAGYSTAQDVIRALPQNFGGGASEDTRTSLEDTFNTSRGSGLNLRGLGAGATLVLINGRRIAASGSDGRFVDVSGIPLSAIDRVEILPDGASAIYGSDAVGGVINFILRDDYDGVETQLKWGSVTSGSTKSTQLAQAFGNHWDSGNFLLSFEYYMRDNLPNAERWQSADSDLTARGGDNFDVSQGNPGTILQGPYSFAIPRGQNGTSLDPATLIPGTSNLYNRNSGWDLLPEQKRWSMVGTVRENLSDRIRLFADTLFSERHSEFLNPTARTALSVPSSNGFFVNPLGTNDPVTVLYSFENDLGYERDEAEVQTAYAAAGGTMAFENSWDVTAYGSYSYARDFAKSDGVINQLALLMALADPDRATAFNPFGDGSNTNPETLASIRDFVIGRTVADVTSFNITAEGTLLRAADRDIRMAGGADFRSQGLETTFVQGATALADSDRRRKVKGAYVEFLVPLIPEHRQYRGVHAAHLSLAARHESYSDFGSATTPKIGLSYSPLTNFTLRASWARSLKAPSLANLDTSRNSALVDFQRDPLAADPNGSSYILIQTGGNDELHEETANTWTTGFEYTTPSRDLSISAGYFSIDFKNRIDQVTYTTSFLQDPIYADIITRNPTAAQVADICNATTNSNVDLQTCLSAPYGAVVDLRVANLAVLKTSGIDFMLSHEFTTGVGNFGSRLDATYILDYARAQFQSSPLMNALNSPGNPVDLRLRGSLSWDFRDIGASAFVHYVNSYEDTSSTEQRTIGSWTTVDLQARFGASQGNPNRLFGTSVAFNVQNLFDNSPPFFNNPAGYGFDPSNSELLGRFVSVQLRKSW